MIKGLLSDHDIELYVRLLWLHFQPDQWRHFGAEGCFTFEQLNLGWTSTDREVWLFCQHERLILITGNRNMESDDALETVIRQLNSEQAVPVVTIARPAMHLDTSYREDCAYRLADIVANLPNLLGTGRQIIP